MNTVENTYNKIGNTIDYIFGGGTKEQGGNLASADGKPTTLEMYGMKARQYHLMRNEWKKDLQYTKPLIESEYMVQTEFKINGGK